MTAESNLITVEVVYATAEEQQLISLKLKPGTTARKALYHVLKHSLIVIPDSNDEQVDPLNLPIGVYGQSVPDDYCLQAGDRLELYRPLHQDPMDRRRKVASQNQ